jgi:hypothetical protein
MIDRRNMGARKVEMDPIKADRFKFDQEDSDDEYDYDTDASSTDHHVQFVVGKMAYGVVRHAVPRRAMQACLWRPIKADRFKFDQEDSDDEYDYDTDAYSIQIMQHRARRKDGIRCGSSCSSTACDASLSLEKSGLVTSKDDRSSKHGSP